MDITTEDLNLTDDVLLEDTDYTKMELAYLADLAREGDKKAVTELVRRGF
jgi:hypothetical protein